MSGNEDRRRWFLVSLDSLCLLLESNEKEGLSLCLNMCWGELG